MQPTPLPQTLQSALAMARRMHRKLGDAIHAYESADRLARHAATRGDHDTALSASRAAYSAAVRVRDHLA